MYRCSKCGVVVDKGVQRKVNRVLRPRADGQPGTEIAAELPVCVRCWDNPDAPTVAAKEYNNFMGGVKPL